MPAILKKSTETATADTGTTAPARGALEAPHDELKRALKRLAAVADRRSAMPMLSNVCIRSNGTHAVLLATDLDISMTIETRWPSSARVCVGAKALADAVAKLPGGSVTVAGLDDGRASVACGAISMHLDALHERDFPKIPATDKLRWSTVAAGPFAEMFERSLPFVCLDHTRFHLNGVLFESNGSMVCTVVTDGHRLHKWQRTLTGCPGFPSGVIVPSKGCREIVKLLAKVKGNCEIAVTQRFFFVRHDGVTLAIKTIDAQYPPYEQVIPKRDAALEVDPDGDAVQPTRRLFTVDRLALRGAVERARVFCTNDKGKDHKGVKLTIGCGTLKVVTDQTSEPLPAFGPTAEADDGFAIGLNPRYIVDFLDVIDDEEVSFDLGDELDPVVLRGADHARTTTVEAAPQVCVLMPMRI